MGGLFVYGLFTDVFKEAVVACCKVLSIYLQGPKQGSQNSQSPCECLGPAPPQNEALLQTINQHI